MANESIVVVGTGAGRVVAVKAGAIEWEQTVEEGGVSALVVHDGWIYARSYPRVTAFRTDGAGGGGERAWSHSTHGAVPGTPVVNGDLVYFLTSGRQLLGLDRTTGQQKKRVDFSEEPSVDTLAIDPQVGEEGTAWFTTSGALCRADLHSLEMTRVRELSANEGATTPPAIVQVDGRRLIVLAVQGTPDSEAGSTVYRLTAEHPIPLTVTSPGQFYVSQNLAARGIFVLLTTADIEFYRVDVSGSPLTAPQLPQLDRWATGTLPVEDDNLNDDGHVYIPGFGALVAMTRGAISSGSQLPRKAWISEATGPMQTPVLDPGHNEVVCANTYALYGIRTDNGKTIWSAAFRDGVSAAPVMLHAGAAN
jgi:hypothetical protein